MEETSNEILNEVLCRSMADLSMLLTDAEQGPCPYGGVLCPARPVRQLDSARCWRQIKISGGRGPH